MNNPPIIEFPVETTSINDIVPIGIPQAWPDKELPSNNFVWVHGQEFDLGANPILAKRYPSGFLPDPRWDFFQFVGTDQEALVKSPQSVQPLGFKGDAHNHTTTLRAAGNSHPNNATQFYIGDSGAGNRTVPSTSVAVTGTITGTGDVTKPQSMTWYCIMRIR